MRKLSSSLALLATLLLAGGCTTYIKEKPTGHKAHMTAELACTRTVQMEGSYIVQDSKICTGTSNESVPMAANEPVGTFLGVPVYSNVYTAQGGVRLNWQVGSSWCSYHYCTPGRWSYQRRFGYRDW